MTDAKTRPGYVSNSQFTAFADCGEKFRLRYLTHAVRQPQGALIAGIAEHDTIEHAYREGWYLDPYAHQEDLVNHFAAIFTLAVEHAKDDGEIRWGGRASKAWPNKEDSLWWLQNGPKMLQRWADVVIHDAEVGNVIWSREGDPLAGIELSLTVPIPGNALPVTGRIDALMIDADGLPFVRDWTTGKPGGKTQLQGSLYSWTLMNADGFGMDIERCEYAYLRGELAAAPAEPLSIICQSFDPRPFMDRAIANFVMMTTAVEAGVFLLKPSSFCSGCEVKASCDYGKTL